MFAVHTAGLAVSKTQNVLNWLELSRFVRVSVQGFKSLWNDCMFIPADWGS